MLAGLEDGAMAYGFSRKLGWPLTFSVTDSPILSPTGKLGSNAETTASISQVTSGETGNTMRQAVRAPLANSDSTPVEASCEAWCGRWLHSTVISPASFSPPRNSRQPPGLCMCVASGSSRDMPGPVMSFTSASVVQFGGLAPSEYCNRVPYPIAACVSDIAVVLLEDHSEIQRLAPHPGAGGFQRGLVSIQFHHPKHALDAHGRITEVALRTRQRSHDCIPQRCYLCI